MRKIISLCVILFGLIALAVYEESAEKTRLRALPVDAAIKEHAQLRKQIDRVVSELAFLNEVAIFDISDVIKVKLGLTREEVSRLFEEPEKFSWGEVGKLAHPIGIFTHLECDSWSGMFVTSMTFYSRRYSYVEEKYWAAKEDGVPSWQNWPKPLTLEEGAEVDRLRNALARYFSDCPHRVRAMGLPISSGKAFASNPQMPLSDEWKVYKTVPDDLKYQWQGFVEKIMFQCTLSRNDSERIRRHGRRGSHDNPTARIVLSVNNFALSDSYTGIAKKRKLEQSLSYLVPLEELMQTKRNEAKEKRDSIKEPIEIEFVRLGMDLGDAKLHLGTKVESVENGVRFRAKGRDRFNLKIQGVIFSRAAFDEIFDVEMVKLKGDEFVEKIYEKLPTVGNLKTRTETDSNGREVEYYSYQDPSGGLIEIRPENKERFVKLCHAIDKDVGDGEYSASPKGDREVQDEKDREAHRAYIAKMVADMEKKEKNQKLACYVLLGLSPVVLICVLIGVKKYKCRLKV